MFINFLGKTSLEFDHTIVCKCQWSGKIKIIATWIQFHCIVAAALIHILRIQKAAKFYIIKIIGYYR